MSGNGNVIEENRDISGFTGVLVSSGIDVYLSEGSDFEVKVEADENLMEAIVTELKGDLLVVKTYRYGIRHARSKKVFVTLPELEKLKISSAGDCVGQTLFNCKDLDLGISSAGDLYAFDLKAKKVVVDVSSAGDARVFATDEISMNVSSAGNIYYKGDAEVIRSRTSSAGNIVKKN